MNKAEGNKRMPEAEPHQIGETDSDEEEEEDDENTSNANDQCK
jgi:hypothetical protein